MPEGIWFAFRKKSYSFLCNLSSLGLRLSSQYCLIAFDSSMISGLTALKILAHSSFESRLRALLKTYENIERQALYRIAGISEAMQAFQAHQLASASLLTPSR
jgi:hypothetical protein